MKGGLLSLGTYLLSGSAAKIKMWYTWSEKNTWKLDPNSPFISKWQVVCCQQRLVAVGYGSGAPSNGKCWISTHPFPQEIWPLALWGLSFGLGLWAQVAVTKPQVPLVGAELSLTLSPRGASWPAQVDMKVSPAPGSWLHKAHGQLFLLSSQSKCNHYARHSQSCSKEHLRLGFFTVKAILYNKWAIENTLLCRERYKISSSVVKRYTQEWVFLRFCQPWSTSVCLFSFHSAQNYSVFLRPNFTDSFKTSEVAFLDHELVAECFDLLL